jgi:hypothetical protein
MSAPVFLSFASNDRKPAETICKAVEQRGLKCWIATRDIGPGDNFQEAITRAIRTAKVMILVFSAHANNSLEVKKEIALAGRYNVIVVPVRVEDVVPNDAMSYELAVRQWIDLFDDWETAIERLVSQLSAAVSAEAAEATPGASKPALPKPEPLSDAKRVRRRPLVPVLAGVVAVLVIIAGGLAWYFWPSARPIASPAGQPARSPASADRRPEPPAASAAPPLQEALAARLQTAAPKLDEKARDEAARAYAAAPVHKALAIPPEAGGDWRVWDRPTRETAVESALEGCQVQFGHPCLLVAADDAMEPIPADGKLPPHDMPRARYSGEFSPAQIPGVGPLVRERSDIVNYSSAVAPKAVAFHPIRNRIFIVTQAQNQHAAEQEALKACNDDPVRNGAGGPCFLYAVDNRVVLPLRLKEPLTPPETMAAASPPAVAPAKPTPAAQAAANRPPRPSTMAERCATPDGMPVIRQYCASSVLPPLVGDRTGRSTYEVANLFDNNPATAWIKARREPGDGWILIDFNGERLVSAIAIANGYQKNGTVFRENYRVRHLRLLSSNGETASLNVADQNGTQRIVLDRPLRAEWLQIIVDDLFPGDREPDVAISELHVISEPTP